MLNILLLIILGGLAAIVALTVLAKIGDLFSRAEGRERERRRAQGAPKW